MTPRARALPAGRYQIRRWRPELELYDQVRITGEAGVWLIVGGGVDQNVGCYLVQRFRPKRVPGEEGRWVGADRLELVDGDSTTS